MPLKNYIAFAIARAFLIRKLFGVWGLLFGKSTVQRFNGLTVDRHFVIRIISIGYL